MRACLPDRRRREAHEHADAPHPLALLRARRQRPRRRRAAEQRDELAPFHSITSSARASSVGGTSRPSALAVLRLMTSSNLVGLLHRQVGGLGAFEDLPAKTPCTAIGVGYAGAIAHQAAGRSQNIARVRSSVPRGVPPGRQSFAGGRT